MITIDGLMAANVGIVGKARVSMSGSFGGGSAQLQAKDPSGAFVDVAGAAFTAAVDQTFDFPDFCQNILQVDLSGSSGASLVVTIQSTLDR